MPSSRQIAIQLHQAKRDMQALGLLTGIIAAAAIVAFI